MQRLKWKRVGSETSINMLAYKAKVIYKQREISAQDILVKASYNFFWIFTQILYTLLLIED